MPAIRKLAMDRRTFLRGSGACLALPWLDAMLPALQRPPAPQARALFVFAPNGVCVPRWHAGEGGTLQPLQRLAHRYTALAGLAIDGGRAHGDGPGDHARAAASFLTCAHPRKTGGADLQAGVSIDQRIAELVGGETTFRSLELGMERGRSAGICDSGYSCAYSNNVSWRAPDQPVAKETDPKQVYARLFGDPRAQLDERARRQRLADDRSLLDLVLADSRSLRGRLGAGDRHKLDQYLDSVRELERRLAALPEETTAPPVPDGLLDGGGSFAERLRLMYELVLLAFHSGQTRVVSLMLGNGGSGRSYPFLDVRDAHHTLSHHGGAADKLDRIARIDRFHVEQFALLLQRMASVQEGDGDLLASLLAVYGSGIGDGNRHNHDDLPVLLCGEGAGAARHRGARQFERDTPMANLYLGILHAMGGKDRAFADSAEALALG